MGLALGAGAAKGWAHVVVIKALKKLGIKIDIVAGCSVGALIGAAYACNQLKPMEKWIRSFNYWDVIRMMDFSWRRGGLLRGERVFNAINEIVGIQNISQCTLKFGAVVTNLSTGRELWLTDGDIQRAIRASCSMPGLFSPVNSVISNSWRSRVRGRISSFKKKRINVPPSAMEIMSISIQVLENRLKRNRMAGDPPDVLIQPYCPQISTLDFHRAEEAIIAGELAVNKELAQLQSLIRK